MKQAGFVREYGTHADCPGLPIDHSANRFDLSFLFVNRLVIQFQRHFRHVFQRFVHAFVLAAHSQ